MFTLHLLVINVHCGLMFSLIKKGWRLIANMAKKKITTNAKTKPANKQTNEHKTITLTLKKEITTFSMWYSAQCQ